MRNVIHVLTVVLLLSDSGQAMGRDKDSYYRVEAVFTCKQFLADWKNVKAGKPPEYYWVAGYITAYNMMARNTYSVLGKSDLNNTLSWLDNYCKANPQSALHQGLTDLLPTLYATRYQTRTIPAK